MIFPPLMASAIRDFNLSLGTAGLFFPAQSIGGMVGGLLIGVWSDSVGRRGITLVGTLVVGLGLLATSFATSWAFFLGAFLLTGLAQSAVGTVINALAADVNRSAQGKGLNILHAVYGLGATVGPLLIAGALSVQVNWRIILLVAGVTWIVYGLITSMFTFPRVQNTGVQVRKLSFELFKYPTIRWLFVVGFVYNGIAMSLLGWVSVYLQHTGVSPFWATSMIPLFYIGLASGRFVCASFSERYGYAKIILVCAIGTGLVYPLVIVGQTLLGLGLGMLLGGFFISGLFPTALAIGSRSFPSLAGTVTGTLSAGATLGTMIPPWWTGLIAETWSFQTAVIVNGFLLIPLLWVAYRLVRHGDEEKEAVITTAS